MTSTYLKAMLVIVLLSVFNACEDEAIVATGECGPLAIISDEFDSKESDDFTITSVALDGACLSIEVSAGGCDGESWTAELLIAEMVALSYPPQVGIRLVLDDDELCEAFIRRTFQFDLSALDEISDRAYVRLQGWEEPFHYPGIDFSTIKGNWNLVHINGGLIGTDVGFNEGEITWEFGDESVVINNQNTDESKEDAFDSGTYPYQVIDDANSQYHQLEVNEVNLGRIVYLYDSTMTVDQREVDGFQYLFSR